MIETVFTSLMTQGPLVTLLIGVIVYFYRREKKCETRVYDLHDELRTQDKDNLQALLRVTMLIESNIDHENNMNDKLLSEIYIMKKDIITQIEALK